MIQHTRDIFDASPNTAVRQMASTAGDIGWPQTANRTYSAVVKGRRVEIALAAEPPQRDLFWELSVDGEPKGFFPTPFSARSEALRICKGRTVSRVLLSIGAALRKKREEA